jgi:hypothetical protein
MGDAIAQTYVPTQTEGSEPWMLAVVQESGATIWPSPTQILM